VETGFRLNGILANAITEGVGAALAIVGAIYLITTSTRGSAWQILSCTVFAATLVLVYLCSAVYQSLVLTDARHEFHVLDHSAIYVLIAGTYTPSTMVSLHFIARYTRYYHEDRIHIAPLQETPAGSKARKNLEAGHEVTSMPRLGGLNHRYDLAV
jgi:hypothetical protein